MSISKIFQFKDADETPVSAPEGFDELFDKFYDVATDYSVNTVINVLSTFSALALNQLDDVDGATETFIKNLRMAVEGNKDDDV
jgi:hypothetical protein